jgi:acetolactate synthase small subunit
MKQKFVWLKLNSIIVSRIKKYLILQIFIVQELFKKKQNIVVYEISGTSERINKFLDDLNTIGDIKVELVRSGPIGLGI